jgi:hypothetical protein
MALQMKPACEKCGRGLAMDGAAAICSYECTFWPRHGRRGRDLQLRMHVLLDL